MKVILFFLFPLFLFAGVIENNISKAYKDSYTNIKIEQIIIKNYHNQKINYIDVSQINTKRNRGTIRINNGYVFYKINAKIKVLKTTTNLNKGEVLSDVNSALEWVMLKSVYNYPLFKISHKSVKMYIPKNRIIYDYMLETPSLVKRGSMITVISHSGGIEVGFQATAMKDAKAGDTIKVRKDNKVYRVKIDKNGNGEL